jgi:hypothetical protein
VVLIGVTYANSTCHQFGEWMSGVSYRHVVERQVGGVGIRAIGNAMVRRFGMRDLVALAQHEASRDENVFRTPEGQRDHVTQLPDGVYVTGDEALDGAGRPERHLWSVVDPQRIVGWRPTWIVSRPGQSG